MIGGAGEQLMLKLVAKHADMRNTFGSPDVFRRKVAILGEHCGAVGRSLDNIEISWAGATFLTESKEEKKTVLNGVAQTFRKTPEEMDMWTFVGGVSEVRERI